MNIPMQGHQVGSYSFLRRNHHKNHQKKGSHFLHRETRSKKSWHQRSSLLEGIFKVVLSSRDRIHFDNDLTQACGLEIIFMC